MTNKPSLALIPSGYKASKLYSILPNNGDGDFTFTRASSATRVNKDGLIETVGNNVPRLDYIDGGCPSLLLEPQRTNLILYSEDFANAAWSKTNATLTLSDEISPTGELNAYKMQGGASAPRRIFEGLSTTIGQDYTYSLYVKKGNTDIIGFTTSSGSLNCTFFLNTLTATNGTIEDAGNGWYRLSSTASAVVASEVWQILLNNADAQGTFHHIFGAQVEQGSYATSYIPTNGSAATRNRDLCNNAGDANTFNDSEGVLYAQIGVELDNGFVSINDGTTSNRISIYLNRTNRTIRMICSSGGVGQVDTTYTSPTSISENVKIALKYKENDFALWVDGSEVRTDNSALTPIGLSRCDFAVNTTLPFYGKCKDLRVYDKVLTDAELQELTTL